MTKNPIWRARSMASGETFVYEAIDDFIDFESAKEASDLIYAVETSWRIQTAWFKEHLIDYRPACLEGMIEGCNFPQATWGFAILEPNDAALFMLHW